MEHLGDITQITGDTTTPAIKIMVQEEFLFVILGNMILIVFISGL